MYVYMKKFKYVSMYLCMCICIKNVCMYVS